MTQRIVFEFLHPVDRVPNEWAHVKKIIEDAGGTHLSGISGEPPYIVTAVLPDEAQAVQVLAALRGTPGVGRADLDATRDATTGNMEAQPDKAEPHQRKRRKRQ